MSAVQHGDESDLESFDQLARRRRDPRLEGGFVKAVFLSLQLFSWNAVSGDFDFTEWAPPSSVPGVRATLLHGNGGMINLFAPDLIERHVVFSGVVARLRSLAERGVGQLPQPTASNRLLAARAVALLAGVDVDRVDRTAERLVDAPDLGALFAWRSLDGLRSDTGAVSVRACN